MAGSRVREREGEVEPASQPEGPWRRRSGRIGPLTMVGWGLGVSGKISAWKSL